MPKKYSENENLASPGLGRPFISDCEKDFQQMIKHLCANDEEQITLNDLKELMDSFLKDSPQQAFTTKCIKYKLQKLVKDEIVIAEINGKPNVTFWTATAEILQNFCNGQGCSDPIGEKARIFAAAKLLKTDQRNEKLLRILFKQWWNRVTRLL